MGDNNEQLGIQNSLQNFLNLLAGNPNYTVPDTLKYPQPHNDAFWERFARGPDKTLFTDLDIDDNIDDVVTFYSQEWLNAVQAITNMISILDKIAVKHNVMVGQTPNLPQGIKIIFDTNRAIIDAEKILNGEKEIFFILEKIRQDWGSVDAFAHAPDQDRVAWIDTNYGTNDRNLELLTNLLLGSI